MTSRTVRACTGLSLILAFASLSVAIWTVIPPPTYALLAVAVAAPEIGAWLAAVAVLAALLALPGLRSDRRSMIALGASLITIGLATSPFLRLRAAERGFEGTMRAALGHDPLKRVPVDVRERLRATPLAISELFFGLTPRAARVTRAIPYSLSDGATLALDVYQPMAHGTFPAIVQIYGGAWQRGAPADDDQYATYLAAHGYTVFAIDYRHAPQWQWSAQIEDVRAALAWVREHAAEYDADPMQMAILGRSSGAQLALVAAYEPRALPVSAVVSYYGPVDLADGYRNPPVPDPLDVRSIEEAFLGGTPDSAAERYREASPISYVSRAAPPSLLIYGGRDHVVLPRYGAMLDARLREAGATSVFLEIPWAEHAFDRIASGPSGQLSLHYTERFLAWAMGKGRRGS